MTGHLEREVKLDADPDLALPDLNGAVAGLHAVARPTLDLDATYFDTVDTRLSAWGVTVRRRTGEGTRWTVKLPARLPAVGDPGAAEGLAVSRREIDVFDTGLAPPDAVVDQVRPWLGSGELVAVVRLVSHRRRLALGWQPSGDDAVAELDDDLVVVHAGSDAVPGPRGVDRSLGPVARFREIEVEQAAEDDRAGPVIAAVVGRLVEAGARTASSPSKLARALDLLGVR